MGDGRWLSTVYVAAGLPPSRKLRRTAEALAEAGQARIVGRDTMMGVGSVGCGATRAVQLIDGLNTSCGGDMASTGVKTRGMHAEHR